MSVDGHAFPQHFSFCQARLREVSRTFSKPIEVLPPELQVALTVGYLLCRVVDTIEDEPSLEAAQRDELFQEFLLLLDGQLDTERFAGHFSGLSQSDSGVRLATNVDKVMSTLLTQPASTVVSTQQWVREMTHGMRLYSQRKKAHDGTVGMATLQDLERYCYFVAGTVGHLITDLFEAHLERQGHVPNPQWRDHAEPFGIGLQMVNILKDAATDWKERSWCYIPESFCRQHGLTSDQLFEESHRASAHQVVAPVFKRAREHLDAALTYSLSIPPAEGRLRLFCLLPLWMAARTLSVTQGNDAMFCPGRTVKISRLEVANVIAECNRHVADDSELVRRYQRLYRQPVPEEARISA